MTVTSMTTVRYPLRPTPEPIKGTLLDAIPAPEEGIGWLAQTASHRTEPFFESFNCMKFQHYLTLCTPPSKVFDEPHLYQSGFWFAVYGGISCSTVGSDANDMKSEVDRVFNSGESTAIEMALMAQRFAVGPDTDPGAPVVPAWPAPTDISGAGAVKPLLGLAQLESHAGKNYVGRPLIHMTRSIATLLFGLGALEWDGNSLRTKLGSKVAAGPGYDLPNTGPTGAAAAAGEKWMYATGEVRLKKGSTEVRDVTAQTTNTVYVLAERAYVGVVDCYAAAIKVQETT